MDSAAEPAHRRRLSGDDDGHAHHDHDHDHGGHGHAHHHDHGREHGHDHAGHKHGLLSGHHHHHHAPAQFGVAFALGAALNIGFVAVEVVYGLLGHSMALLADAGHNLGDVLGLLGAWSAALLSRRRPSARFTYGLGSSSVLAALFNAVVLLVITGAVAAEAVRRLFQPEPAAGFVVMGVAAAGIAVNGFTAGLFARGRKGDLNVRGAYLHMLSDAVVAAGVVVTGAVILFTGWSWLDPVVSLVISAMIVWGTWSLLREALSMALDAVPAGIEPAEVRAHLLGRDGVAELHDLHIWAMSTTETALTCHLVMPRGHPGDATLAAICEGLQERFGIGHSTLQVEIDAEMVCRLETTHGASWRNLDYQGEIKAMTVLDRVRDLLTSLAPKAACDDCIADRLQIAPRQHANHKTRELEKLNGFDRRIGECIICKRTDKKVIRAV